MVHNNIIVWTPDVRLASRSRRSPSIGCGWCRTTSAQSCICHWDWRADIASTTSHPHSWPRNLPCWRLGHGLQCWTGSLFGMTRRRWRCHGNRKCPIGNHRWRLISRSSCSPPANCYRICRSSGRAEKTRCPPSNGE